MQAYITERLVGETGDPGRVAHAARALVEKALPAVVEGLKQTLSLDVGVEIASVELSRMVDAKPEGEGHAMMVIAASMSPDALVMSVDADALALAVSMIFGGDPGIGIVPIRRELSPTEAVVASRVLAEVAGALGRVNDGQLELRFPVPQAISGGELRKYPLRDGPAARVVLSLTMQAGSGGTISLTMPQRLLLKKPGAEAASTGPAAQWGKRFGEEVMRSGVEIQATMPVARMTLGQIAGLQVGQLIEFDADAQSQVKLSARQKTLFVCDFGKLGQNYTVRVRHPFDAAQDTMDELVARR
jgi:flagellar motor switch protein FliM